MRLLRLCLAFLPARWLDYLCAVLSTFAAGLQTLQKGHHLLPVLGLSLFLWLVVGLSNMLVLHAFDLHFPLYAIGLILVLQTFGAVSPLVQVSSARIMLLSWLVWPSWHPPRTRPQCGAGHARVVLLSLHSGRPGLPVARKPVAPRSMDDQSTRACPCSPEPPRHVGIDVALTAA